MRDGDSAPESGRTELFTGKKAVENGTAGDALIVFKEQAGLFEDALFTTRIEVEQDVFGRQELIDLAHTVLLEMF